jgi:type II secretory pathway pseudopilin PulG
MDKGHEEMRLVGTRRNRKRSRRSGFTLFEILVAMPLVLLLILGTMGIYITATKTFAKTSAAVYSSMDASNAIQHVIDLTREAQSYALSTENTFTLPSGYTLASLSTSYNGETINAAMELVMPPTVTASEVGYQAGNPTQVSVMNSSGSSVTLSPSPYYANGSSVQTYLIYRGDANGNADPNPSGQTTTAGFSTWLSAQAIRPTAGTYLWQYNVQTGSLTALCKSVALSPDAVQFVRPTSTPGVNGGVPEPYEVEVKVVSSYYSPINGNVSDEESGGAEASSLDGKCVYMRDHQTSPTTPSNANTLSTNNAFQYSK